MEDYTNLPYRNIYFIDIGELDIMADINHVEQSMIDIIDWMDENIKGEWRMASRVRAIDLYHELWFSFDNEHDAMLSRMTWSGLKHAKHAIET